MIERHEASTPQQVAPPPHWTRSSHLARISQGPRPGAFVVSGGPR